MQIKEMQIRNYSPRTIKTYCSLLIKLEKDLGKSLYEVTAYSGDADPLSGMLTPSVLPEGTPKVILF